MYTFRLNIIGTFSDFTESFYDPSFLFPCSYLPNTNITSLAQSDKKKVRLTFYIKRQCGKKDNMCSVTSPFFKQNLQLG